MCRCDSRAASGTRREQARAGCAWECRAGSGPRRKAACSRAAIVGWSIGKTSDYCSRGSNWRWSASRLPRSVSPMLMSGHTPGSINAAVSIVNFLISFRTFSCSIKMNRSDGRCYVARFHCAQLVAVLQNIFLPSGDFYRL
jgi:hypothetical protein